MRKIITLAVFFWILIIICILMMSGCSGKWHAERAKRHELLAIAKGVKIDNDTVYKDRVKYIRIAGSDSAQEFSAVIDTSAFEKAMDANDSLVAVILELQGGAFDSSFGVDGDPAPAVIVDKEKIISSLKKANSELKALRKRIAQGFQRDSTYHLKPDSLTDIEVVIKDGLLKSANYKRKEQVVKVEERIPIEIRRILSYGYTWWQVGLCALFFIVVGYILGRVTKSNG